MKLKQQQDDFQVEEITDIRPASVGPFAFYRLEKRGWSTPDALGAIRRRWHLGPNRLSYGGLKDRHAATVQYLTIHHGPRRGLHHQDVTLHYLGQAAAPYTSQDIVCNRFHLTLRDLPLSDRVEIASRVSRVAAEGTPNYFDDQRFGSVTGEGGEFIARLLVRGQFEEALRLALVASYEHDRGPQKKEKRILAECWGDWPRCKENLQRGHARSLVDYLCVHPGDYRGAIARLRPELRGLYLSAYQSDLWNRMLAHWLRRHCRPEQLQLIALRLGKAPLHCGVDPGQMEDLARLWLPLPSARLHLEPGDARSELVQAVLAEEGLELRDLQIRGIREMFFSKGERAALCLPAAFTWAFEADDLHAGRDKLTLHFDLGRGCYATMVVKAITLQTGNSSRKSDNTSPNISVNS
jgi:tRNA pseudouridine13 synthase